MNIASLQIISEECCANITPGQVIAIRRPGDSEWHDPFGGFFNEKEQASLDDVARGDEQTVCLSSVDGRPRIFGAHLIAKF